MIHFAAARSSESLRPHFDAPASSSNVTVQGRADERSFLGFSYGFRPAHNALDALSVGMRKRVNWIIHLDIRSFSTSSSTRGWSGLWNIGSGSRP